MDAGTWQAMTDKATVVLETVDLDGYYGSATAADDAIAAIGRVSVDASPHQRRAFSAGLSRHARHVMGRFALRAPMLALQLRDGSRLRDGLIVHCLLEQTMGDWRDDLVGFALYHYVACQLGLDPIELFDEAARYAIPELATLMNAFGRRTDITLGVFGWRRVETPDGPTFEMVTWRHGPSGAVVGTPAWESVNGRLVRELQQWLESQGAQRRLN